MAHDKTSSPRRSGKTLGLAVYFVVVSLLCVGALEVAARLGLPNSYHRVKLQSMAEMRSAPTAVVLGDSFSLPEWEGLRTFSDLLQERLGEAGFNTVNLASSGTGPLDYLESYRKYGIQSRPKVVLVNYYVGNDISDTISRTQGDTWWKHFIRDASTYSYLANVAMDIRAGYRTRARLSEINVESVPESSRPLNPFLLETALHNPRYVLQNLSLTDSEANAAWLRNRDALLELARLVRSTGASLVIDIFPHTAQVNSYHYDFFRTLGLEVDEQNLLEEIPQQRLREFCQEQGLRCIDLLPFFRAKASVNHYLDNDDHWNAEGHRLAFDVVWQTLSSGEQSLIAATPRAGGAPEN